ncbi:glycoside hydrolase family 2 TIM barrel-domain containing protein [Seonamhaeicola sp.]|uniref:glycoside hydrolase family 2 TIM barrel-domain containing protein n=1 Tax=Seonamhaeicola sp. TaxID=1912245 RepID=UPI00261DE2C1|nr:glycoside hydrolase family 2 TIM barrel-domain containing protein [Seonamhaeicola sp.]
MKPIKFVLIGAVILFFSCAKEKVVEVSTDFNFNWKFKKGDMPGVEKADFDDASWENIRLPHDWSVAESFTQENAGGATAFLPGGIGWYRKTFRMPESASGKLTRINFDGVYNDSEVYINGHLLGKRPYGYIGFYYDLTPYLNYGDNENVIAVKADRTAYLDCRWYPGSGIYRNVRLETLNKVHIQAWGTFITTPDITEEKASVSVQNTVVNKNEVSKTIDLHVSIIDKAGNQVAEVNKSVDMNADETKEVEQTFEVISPKLWDIETPNLYTAKISIRENNQLLDTYIQRFGIRDIEYDAEKGFFLNGKQTLFKGVCLHHDGGLVGAAVPKGVWKRRLERLKEAGCNAIRTAHNPPSEEFLDLCDEMGFLVQDEAFDEWDNPKDKRHNFNQQKAEEITKGYTEHIHEWAEEDVKSMVLRDRNHPSIVMWSIGNEIEWTYPSYQEAAGYWEKERKVSMDGFTRVDYYYDEPPYSIPEIKERFKNAVPDNYELTAMAKNLSKWIKEIDTTRPVTGNLVIPSVSYFTGYTDALDIVGLSYRQSVYDYVHRNYPEKLILGTENWAQWHEWKPVIDKDYVHGVFLWTGIFYMGESRTWPIKGSSSGLLDFAGYKRPSYHMFKTLWNEEPHVYFSTTKMDDSPYEFVNGDVLHKRRNDKYIPMWGWHKYNDHWNYEAGESTVVEVFTNCEEVELFLNGSSLGVQKLADNMHDHIIKWHVPFSSGKLVAKGKHTSGTIVEYQLRSAQSFGAITATPDKTVLKANGYDVVHIEVELTDKDGVPVRVDDREVVFDVKGDCKILGVDNGARDNVQDIQTNKIVTANGRCLLIVQSNLNEGLLEISASSGEITSDVIQIEIKK